MLVMTGVGVECRMIFCVRWLQLYLLFTPDWGLEPRMGGEIERAWWSGGRNSGDNLASVAPSAQCPVPGLISHGAISTVPPAGPRPRSISG